MDTEATLAVLGGVLIEIGSRNGKRVECSTIIKDFDDKSLIVLRADIHEKFFRVVEVVGVANEIRAGFINSKGDFVYARLGKSKFTRFILHKLADSLKFGGIAGSRQALVYDGGCFGHSISLLER